MKQPLLSTKIQVPPIPRHLVRRTRLHLRLDEGLQSNRRMTLLAAPAGYGKTTLLSAWLQAQTAPAAWLTLDTADNDPIRFLNYLHHALLSTLPSLDLPESIEDLGSPADVQYQLLHPMINSIGARAENTVLILDDYHFIESKAIHNHLTFLLEHLPPQGHIFMATRADPPLPIARLRGRGHLVELRMDDLKFQPEETSSFLKHFADLELDPTAIDTLSRRTEGWISGLQMAALSMRGQGDASAFIQDFSGSHRYIMEYLLDEVLNQLDPETYQFLLETSILNRLSAPLCDHVRSREGEVYTSSQQILDKLDQANLFIIPLDQQRNWYRYHRLFSDLLQAHLNREQPHLIPDLHRSASEWTSEHSLIDEAIHHGLRSKDFGFAADLIETHGQDKLIQSETLTFLQWVQQLPENEIRQRPKLGIYRAWALLLQGAPLNTVEAQLHENDEEHDPPGSSESLQAFVAISRGNFDRSLQLAQKALELLPEEEHYLRDFALLCLAGSQISLGEFETGIQKLEQASINTQRRGDHSATVMMLCELAEIRLKQLKLDEAEQLYRRAQDLGTDPDGDLLPIAGQALIGLGDIALERFDLNQAEQYVREGIHLTRNWSLIGTLDGYFSLAMIYDALGDRQSTQEALAAMEELAAQFDASDIDDLVAALLKSTLYSRRGDLAAMQAWVVKRKLEGVPVNKPAWSSEQGLGPRLYKYELPIVARWHLAQERAEAAVEVVDELVAEAEEYNRPNLIIEAEILRAIAFQQKQQLEKACEALLRAIKMAAVPQSRRLFLTEMVELNGLLRQAKNRLSSPVHIQFVESVLERGRHNAPSLPSIKAAKADELSPRELEILRLMPSDLTAEELAEKLFISVNTVRTHMKNIYSKLAVHSRHEAVAKAAKWDLI